MNLSKNYRSYLFISIILLYIIFEITSFYQIINGHDDCYNSLLWIFCIVSGCLIPLNLMILLFSAQSNNDYCLYILVNTFFILLNLSVLIFGLNELFLKCPNLYQYYIWTFGLINSSMIFLILIFIIIFGCQNFSMFYRINSGFSNTPIYQNVI